MPLLRGANIRVELASGSHTASDEPRTIAGVSPSAKADKTRDRAGNRQQEGFKESLVRELGTSAFSKGHKTWTFINKNQAQGTTNHMMVVFAKCTLRDKCQVVFSLRGIDQVFKQSSSKTGICQVPNFVLWFNNLLAVLRLLQYRFQ